jgi:phage shock protein PspC (stress-responsive transcriptional regulator)
MQSLPTYVKLLLVCAICVSFAAVVGLTAYFVGG